MVKAMLEKRVGRLEEWVHLSEREQSEREKQAKKTEELMELLRQEEAYRSWLNSASIEALEHHLQAINEAYQRNVSLPVEEKFSAEEIACGLPRCEHVFYAAQRDEVEVVITRKRRGSTRWK